MLADLQENMFFNKTGVEKRPRQLVGWAQPQPLSSKSGPTGCCGGTGLTTWCGGPSPPPVGVVDLARSVGVVNLTPPVGVVNRAVRFAKTEKSQVRKRITHSGTTHAARSVNRA